MESVILCFDEFELDAANLELRRKGEPVKADGAVLRRDLVRLLMALGDAPLPRLWLN